MSEEKYKNGLFKTSYIRKYRLANFEESYGEPKYSDETFDTKLSGYRLLHGNCDAFSLVLAQRLKEDGYDTKVVRADNADLGICYIHQYCVIEVNGKLLYADVRGVTRRYNEFMKEFLSFEYKAHGFNIELSDIDTSEVFVFDDSYESIQQELLDQYDNGCTERTVVALSDEYLNDNYDDFLERIDELTGAE